MLGYVVECFMFFVEEGLRGDELGPNGTDPTDCVLVWVRHVEIFSDGNLGKSKQLWRVLDFNGWRRVNERYGGEAKELKGY